MSRVSSPQHRTPLVYCAITRFVSRENYTELLRWNKDHEKVVISILHPDRQAEIHVNCNLRKNFNSSCHHYLVCRPNKALHLCTLLLNLICPSHPHYPAFPSLPLLMSIFPQLISSRLTLLGLQILTLGSQRQPTCWSNKNN